MELFYNRYRYEKDTVGSSETPTDVPYMPFYSVEIGGVFNGLTTVLDGVRTARFDAPIDGKDGSVEGMRKLKDLFELYETYLNTLEKDRELAKTKKEAEDTRLRFWAYYNYTITALGNLSGSLGIIIPTTDETNNDSSTILQTRSLDDVQDIKSKYERLLYNDVVSVQGSQQKNDILAKLKELAKNSLNDYVDKFDETYKSISLGTKYQVLDTSVSNAYIKRNEAKRAIDKYSQLQIIKAPYIPTIVEPNGINMIIINSVASVYKDYMGFNNTLDGLKDKAMKYIDFDNLRPDVRDMIVAYNKQYNENLDARNFKIPNVSGISFDRIQLSQIVLHSPSTSSFIDGSSGGFSDIAYVNDSIEKTETRLDQLKKLQEYYNVHFSRFYMFIKVQAFAIMQTAKRIYDRFKTNKDVLDRLDQTTLSICANLDNLSTDLSTSRFTDAVVINLLNPADYTSYNSEVPVIISKYIKAINTMLSTNMDVGEIQRSQNIDFENIYQQLKETQSFFMITQRLIPVAGLSSNNLYRYPIDNFVVNDRKTADSISTAESIYKVYLGAFKAIYDELLKTNGVVDTAIKKFSGIYTANKMLIDKAKGSFISGSKSTDFQTLNTQATNEISNLRMRTFYTDLIAPNVESVKNYKNDDPRFKNISNLNTSILDIYNKYDSGYEYIVRTLGLIPLDRKYRLDGLNKLDDTKNLSLTIPNSNIIWFTDLNYLLIGGGGSGAQPGMKEWGDVTKHHSRGGGGGASGQLKSTVSLSTVFSLNNTISPVAKVNDITNDIIVKLGKGGEAKGETIETSSWGEREKAQDGDQGGSTTIQYGSTTLEAKGGLGGNGYSSDWGSSRKTSNFNGGNNPIMIEDSVAGGNGQANVNPGGGYNNVGIGGTGGAFTGLFNIESPSGGYAFIDLEANGPRGLPDKGVDGPDFTGSGGGGGASCWESGVGREDVFIKSGAGGIGYAVLTFSRNQPLNIPISQYYNFVNNAADNWDGPNFNKKCSGSYESDQTGFTRFIDAVQNGTGNRIIFSPITTRFYRLNASDTSNPEDVEDINDVGYTYWDYNQGSLSGRKFGGVEFRMSTEGFTNPPPQLQKLAPRMPQKPPSNPTVYRFGTSLDDAFRGSLLT